MIRALLGRKFQADLFLPSLLLGFEGYAIFDLLPKLLADLKDPAAVDLAIFAGLLVLVFSQLELGRRLSLMPPGSAMRDMVFGQSAAFLLFALAPESLWLLGGLIVWILFSSGLLIALGRWTLLAPSRPERIRDATSSLAGIAVGLAAARLFPYHGWSTDALSLTGIGLAILTSLRIHFFAGSPEGYSAGGALWFIRDLRRDLPTIMMLTQSGTAGLMIGLLLFSDTQIGAVIFGLAGAIAFLEGFSLRYGAATASHAGHLLAGGALLVDAVFWQTPVISPFVLALASALTLAAVRVGAWSPRAMITTAERMGLHNLAVGVGITAAGGIILRQDPPLYTLGGIGALLIGASLLTNALSNHGRSGSEVDDDQPDAM